MNKSENIQNLAAALSKTQAELPAIKFDSVNPFLKNGYASLGAIIAGSRPVLAKNGLAATQLVFGGEGVVGVETILIHSSGEWISDRVSMQAGEERGKSSAQVAGSIVTYLRRYALASILGIYADEDGDGNEPKPAESKAREKKKTESLEDDVDETVEAQKASKGKYARPMQPEVLKEALQTKAAKAQPASEKQTNLVRMLLLEHFADRDDERHQAQEYLTGQRSFSDIDPKMISALLDWMKPIKNPDGSGSYLLDKDAKLELTMVAHQFMEDLGQERLEI